MNEPIVNRDPGDETEVVEADDLTWSFTSTDNLHWIPITPTDEIVEEIDAEEDRGDD